MIQCVRGTKDLTPDVILKWQFVEDRFKEISSRFMYKEIRTPIFEKTEVFSRGIGEGTDVVNKEMYTFEDRGGDSLTLRPENTAAIARSVIQNGMINQGGTARLWYFGPFFRYERPQKGRQRMFHQYGAEFINASSPESDVEMIILACEITKALGISDYKLLLNSIGNDESRKNYREALINFLKEKKDQLSKDSQNRLENNPLRVLDSKAPEDKEVTKDAPIILDYLDEESSTHFNQVKLLLDKAGVNYEINPFLVRGLDYYSHTVFELQSSALGSQDSFGGGGRYNSLFQQLGNKREVPAVGFAMGVERLILILDHYKAFDELNDNPDIYIAKTGDEMYSKMFEIASILREKNLKVSYDLEGKSMKAQFKQAGKLNAKYVVIIGEEELANGIVNIKNMEKSEQFEVKLEELKNYNF